MMLRSALVFSTVYLIADSAPAASGAQSPRNLAVRSILYDYFDRWGWDRTLERIHHALQVKCCEQTLHEASPTTAIIICREPSGQRSRGFLFQLSDDKICVIERPSYSGGIFRI
jgi:hypothetical protein